MNLRLTRLVGATVLAAALVLAACGGSDDSAPKMLSGYVLDPAPSVGGFTLPDASNDGAEFAFTAGEGRFLIVYFGYLSCPDICPTTLPKYARRSRCSATTAVASTSR